MILYVENPKEYTYTHARMCTYMHSTIRANKRIQHGCKDSDQYTKIYFIPICWQWITWKWNYKNDSIYNNIKNNKLLSNKFFKKEQDLDWNYKILWKQIKDLNTWKDSWIVRLSTVKIAILLKMTYRFKAIIIKISDAFFGKNCKADSNMHMEMHVIQKSQILKKKCEVKGLTVSHFKLTKKLQ